MSALAPERLFECKVHNNKLGEGERSSLKPGSGSWAEAKPLASTKKEKMGGNKTADSGEVDPVRGSVAARCLMALLGWRLSLCSQQRPDGCFTMSDVSRTHNLKPWRCCLGRTSPTLLGVPVAVTEVWSRVEALLVRWGAPVAPRLRLREEMCFMLLQPHHGAHFQPVSFRERPLRRGRICLRKHGARRRGWGGLQLTWRETLFGNDGAFFLKSP